MANPRQSARSVARKRFACEQESQSLTYLATHILPNTGSLNTVEEENRWSTIIQAEKEMKYVITDHHHSQNQRFRGSSR
jgi:hypothetical protein